MTLSSHHLFPHSLYFTIPPTTFSQTPTLKTYKFHSFGSLTIRYTNPFHLKARQSEMDVQKRIVSSDFDFNFNSLLSVMELTCLISSAIVSVGLAVNGSKSWLLMVNGNSVVWVILILVSGIAVVALIQRRQWRRISRKSLKGGLVKSIEKLEDDLKSSVRVIRVLSRHVEKLGKRFQVTRYNLKDPITQSAAVAQKNSEATRALAVQSEILEKELREIQKILLAMQEQQQKQLDLILSLRKPDKLWENQRKTPKEQDTLETINSAEDEVKRVEDHKI